MGFRELFAPRRKPRLRTPAAHDPARMQAAWEAWEAWGDREAFFPRPEDKSFWAYRDGASRQLTSTEAAQAIIVELLIRCPWQVCQGDQLRPRPVPPTHPLFGLNRLLRRPQRGVAGLLWREAFVRAAVCEGNAWAQIMRTVSAPDELRLCRAPQRVAGQVRLRVQPIAWNGTDPPAQTTRLENLVHFHAFGTAPNTLEAPSPLRGAGRQSMETAQAAQRANRNTMVRGATSGQVVVESQDAHALYGNRERLRRIRTQVRDQFSDPENAGAMPVLPAGFDVSGGSISGVNPQLLDQLKFAIEEAGRLYRMDAGFLGQWDKGANPPRNEQLNSRLEWMCIRPWADRLGSAFTEGLIADRWQDEEVCIFADTSHIGLGTLSERAQTADLLASRAGLWTIDEGRELTDQEPLPNGEGRKVQPSKGAPAPPDPTAPPPAPEGE